MSALPSVAKYCYWVEQRQSIVCQTQLGRSMSPENITAYFTRTDETFAFARWGRPIAPIVFGVEDETLGLVKSAIEVVTALANHSMAETDSELGSNMMIFFFREWKELCEVPKLDQIVPELGALTLKLEKAQANQYRFFRFDEAGGIKACFIFVRMDEHLNAVSAETLCLSQIVQSILLWSDCAFQITSPLALMPNGGTILRPEIGELIRAAYDPALAVYSDQPSHALRMFARMQSQSAV